MCGSIVAACSGTIDTPTEENPRRSSARQTPAATNTNGTGSTPTPRAPTPPADDEADDEEEEDDETPPAVNPNTPAAEDEDEPAAVPAGDLSFASDIWPIFNGSCGPCHVTDGIVSNFGDPDVDQAFENAEGFEDRVLAVIEAGRMPLTCAGGEPGSTGCLSVDDAEAIEAWYGAGAPE